MQIKNSIKSRKEFINWTRSSKQGQNVGNQPNIIELKDSVNEIENTIESFSGRLGQNEKSEFENRYFEMSW